MHADNSVPPASILKGITLIRRFLSRGFNLLLRAFLGLNVADTQSGYKIFRTEFLVNSIKKVAVTNAFYDVALLYHARKQGARIVEESVKYEHADGSSFKPLLLTLGMGISLVAFGLEQSRMARYIPKSLKKLYFAKFRWI